MEKKMKQSCPRRIGEFGPWDRKEGLDRWEVRDFAAAGERQCSFCGSIHPEEFENFLDRILAGPETDFATRIEQSDKGYKVYLIRPEVRNSDDGPLKFYKQHCHGLKNSTLQRLDQKYQQALIVSQKRFLAVLDRKTPFEQAVEEATMAEEEEDNE